MLEVYGSKHSLLPRICEVDAVGMGATSSELRTPLAAIFSRRPVQSWRSPPGISVTPHISGWRMPLDTGEPG